MPAFDCRALGRSLALVVFVVAVSGCATPPPSPIAGYTCCNLRSYDGWIYSNNVQGGTLVPIGAPARIDSLKRGHYAYGTVAGNEIGFRDDDAKSGDETLAWLRRVIVPQDPRVALADSPADIRRAVLAGRVMRGMTRDQVAMAIGHPGKADTPSLGAVTWTYWTTTDGAPIRIGFDAEGLLHDLQGPPMALRLIVLTD